MCASKIKIKKNYFEKMAWEKDLYVCGIDEVGRGCLAGSVVVAAVILPIKTTRVFKDSKILTEDEREDAYKWITRKAFFTTTILSHRVIDRVNIYNSTLCAMKRAFIQINEIVPFAREQIRYLLVDAMPIKIEKSNMHENLELHHFPFGESVSTSIAAASIVAKVTRDRLMGKIDLVMPGFQFAQHKGYGTREHLKTIKDRGVSLIHRQSFLNGILNDGIQLDIQQSLFEE